ncbi:MAG: SRPBCC family protein [Gammaproteobacteria bacterium]
MRRFDVQGIDLAVPRSKAFAFIADPAQLPKWTNAFASVTAGRAVMRTPSGEVMIDLQVQASAEMGTVDWRMRFPDHNVATAFSRLVEIDPDRCILSFVLTPPPVPLEQLEGALEAQARTLAEELKKLKQILEHHG